MKILILAIGLLASLSGMAQSVAVNPQLMNFGYAVQVQVYNSTKDNIDCSGTITLHTQANRIETNYFHEYVRSGEMSYSQMFYLMDNSDRINFANHFINCYKAN